MPGSSLELSPSTEQRILAAAEVLRISPEAFLRRLLSQHYNTLGGIPLDLLRYIFTFLDYTTISALVARVSKFWQDCVLESPQNFFSRLRQIHGIHLLDPVHGMFYFPRALRHVVLDTKGKDGATGGPPAGGPRSGAGLRRAVSPVSAALPSNVQVVPASSFLTVDIRTQNTKSLPWGYVQMTVRRAIERERAEFGAVRTPGLQQPEDPVWSQAATVTYDRHIYAFGGETYEGVVLNCAYEYNPMTKHWTVLPELNEKRAAASAVAFQGRIFVFGGYNENGEVLDTYEVLDVPTRSWVSRHYPPSLLYTSHTGESVVKEKVKDPTSKDAAPARTAAAAGTVLYFETISNTVTNVLGASVEQYRMPEKICGTTTTVYGDVIIFAGGHRSFIAPEQTAVSYSAMNSTSTTPVHNVERTMVGGGVSIWSVASTPSPGFGSRGDTSTGGGSSARSVRAGGNNSVLGDGPMSTTASTPPLGGFENISTPPTTATATTAAGAVIGVSTTAGGGYTANLNGSTHTNSPPRLLRVSSIAFDGPATAETLVWVFSPITGQWWKDGPRLPSPRAFGALTTLELPVLGTCLCYFGGCARADAPETTMLYIPLCDARNTRLHGAQPDDAVTCARTDDALHSEKTGNKNVAKGDDDEEEKGGEWCIARAAGTASFLHAVQDPWSSSLRATDVNEGRKEINMAAATLTSAATLDTSASISPEPGSTPLTTTRLPTKPTARTSAVDMVSRCFRDLKELPWQRYVRVPIGGAFTSVAVLGQPYSRTVVLTGFYPAANIGFCKVDSLLHPDALTPLLGALSPPLRPVVPPAATTTERATPPVPPLLDVTLQSEAAAAANHYRQEQEWSHQQRQEVREMVRSAARAATLRHPRNPQMAGEERKWSLAPVPEVRMRTPTGPVLTRVSWKVQSLNAKVIVGIE